MENAPLTLAHSHARNAALETRKANAVVASQEHDLAAAEFAKATRGTEDTEALRTLRLLEDHHRRLSQIIKAPSTTTFFSEKQEEGSEKSSTTPAEQQAVGARPLSPTRTAKPSSPVSTRRRPARDLQSSIASNLATARGIPGSQQRRGTPSLPAVSAQHVGGRLSTRPDKAGPSEEQTSSKEPSQRPLRPTSEALAALKQPSTKQPASTINPPPPTSTDEPFQKFFSTFESLFTKLSAPLAFAGLPLDASTPSVAPSAPSPTTPAAVPAASTPHTRATTDPEYSQLFSRAALRALREDKHNTHGTPFGGAESFYLVPTSGGTVSYADILAQHHHHGHALPHPPLPGVPEESGSGNMDEFVDAREDPQTPDSPRSVRAGPAKTATATAATATAKQEQHVARKTREELELENGALRQLLDTQSRRLAMWEASSQSQSMALAQSVHRLPHPHGGGGGPPYPTSPASSRRPSLAPPADAADASAPTVAAVEPTTIALRDLEDRLRISQAETAQLARENEKLQTVLGRYREKWEVLKQGAKERRSARIAGGEGGGMAGKGGGGGGDVGGDGAGDGLAVEGRGLDQLS
ncbi:hypothetical protein W97_03676 [Coniosporium apollinis CBS 100218]|uniref:Uncharacterized protein n=1 Tax=Coniosporium apollinis (strain CBS 100218) TaxID=1168221 RepID=R7YR96_CONA1|nr:uncharacterized protein W97_03676 [Coniosporium apollinis CBS 100218]EON64445.1 hypothetical protein W97_03676 [Coniosporium apollinis CBS 100218]